MGIIDFLSAEGYKLYLDFQRSDEYRYLKNIYGRTTIFDILGVERKEIRHSKFIRWLLDVNGSHKLNDFSIRKLIETLCFAYKKYGELYLDTPLNNEQNRFLFSNAKENEEKNSFLKQLMSGDYTVSEFYINCEESLDEYGRADIFIKLTLNDKKVLLLIENKVTSKENNNQTDNYIKYMSENDSEYDFLIPVYLYPESNKNVKLAISKNSLPCKNALFLIVSYQYLLDGVLIPCLNEMTENSEEFNYLNDYIVCLGRSKIYSESDSETDKKSNDSKIIMAVSKQISTKSVDLYKKYKSIFVQASQELLNGKDFLLNIVGSSDFYLTVLNQVKPYIESPEEDAKTEEDRIVLANITSINKGETFYVRDKNGNVVKFVTNGDKNRTIGAAVYYLFKEYCSHNTTTAAELRDLLKEYGIKPNSWLINVLITESEVTTLCDEWVKAYKGKPLCNRYFQTEKFDENNKFKRCPADIGKKFFKDYPFVSDEKACPIREITNAQLNVEYNSDHQCKCIYFFLHNFYCNGVENLDIIKNNRNIEEFSLVTEDKPKGINKTFGSIDIGNEKIYLARFWSSDHVMSVAKALGMTEYINKNEKKIKKCMRTDLN